MSDVLPDDARTLDKLARIAGLLPDKEPERFPAFCEAYRRHRGFARSVAATDAPTQLSSSSPDNPLGAAVHVGAGGQW